MLTDNKKPRVSADQPVCIAAGLLLYTEVLTCSRPAHKLNCFPAQLSIVSELIQLRNLARYFCMLIFFPLASVAFS